MTVAIQNDAQLEPYAPPASVPALTGTIARLADWADEARAANSLARSLCGTSFVPAHFKHKPEEATAAILTGHELGLSPMASLRAIFVISGTPGMYAKAMVAVVMSKGHEVWVEEQTDERVVVCGRRKGSEHVARTVWDRARVVKAKLTSNSKYQDSPQQMMTARGQAEICRQIAPDALHGIAYCVEELDDLKPGRVEATVGAATPVTAAEILGTAPAPTPEPAPAAVEPEVEPESLKEAKARATKLRTDIARIGRTRDLTADEIAHEFSEWSGNDWAIQSAPADVLNEFLLQWHAAGSNGTAPVDAES